MRQVFLPLMIMLLAGVLVSGTEDSARMQKKDPAGSVVLLMEKSTSPAKVTRVVTCRAIENREPLAVAEKFPRDVGKVYCFCQLEGVQNLSTIVHRWYFQNSLVGNIALRVKGETWRTFSYKNIAAYMAGQWKVEVVNGENDEVLEIVTFAVE